MGTKEDPFLEVKDLAITFRSKQEVTSAVKGISFDLKEGRTLAIVGESGSGKSVTALSLTNLLPAKPACEITGNIVYQGRDILKLNNKELQKVRGREIAYIFQEPSTSLNPVFTVGNQIAEAVRLHVPEVKDVRQYVIESLRQVGIREPEHRYDAYPHELSGGMQQRVMIAMALACLPKLLVADEPTTALDVTIQKQIMDLLRTIRETRAMSIILITHNFGIVSDFADDVIVMFRGKIVERGSVQSVLKNPQHPYTKALLKCIPRLGQHNRRLTTIDYSEIEAFEHANG